MAISLWRGDSLPRREARILPGARPTSRGLELLVDEAEHVVPMGADVQLVVENGLHLPGWGGLGGPSRSPHRDRRNDDAEQRCEMSFGKSTVQATLDAAGMPRRASIPTNGVVVDIERAVTKGSF